jgi:PIN domain
MDAFDADALIAAASDQALGQHVRALFGDDPAAPTAPPGMASVLVVAELAMPLRTCNERAIAELRTLLRSIELRAVTDTTVDLATALAAKYDVGALPAVHLATAIVGNADRFITKTGRGFPRTADEISIVTLADLARASRSGDLRRRRSVTFLAARQ